MVAQGLALSAEIMAENRCLATLDRNESRKEPEEARLPRSIGAMALRCYRSFGKERGRPAKSLAQLAAEKLKIRLNHHFNQPRKVNISLPTQGGLGL